MPRRKRETGREGRRETESDRERKTERGRPKVEDRERKTETGRQRERERKRERERALDSHQFSLQFGKGPKSRADSVISVLTHALHVFAPPIAQRRPLGGGAPPFLITFFRYWTNPVGAGGKRVYKFHQQTVDCPPPLGAALLFGAGAMRVERESMAEAAFCNHAILLA